MMEVESQKVESRWSIAWSRWGGLTQGAALAFRMV